MMGDATTPPLLPLREDLVLNKAAATKDGLPTWSIYDPVCHQYYKIGWAEFEILCRWGEADIDHIVELVNQQTTLSINDEAVTRLALFLNTNNLCQINGEAAIKELLSRKHKIQHLPFLKKVTKLLFFRFRLIRPDPSYG